jgi:hypothetical protein
VTLNPPPPTDPTLRGIRFGSRRFSEPIPFMSALAIPAPGIYVILILPNIWASPRQYRPLYIGESSNVGQRVTDQHEKFGSWIREAAGSKLYVAYHLTGLMTDQLRKDAECELIAEYNPPCNIRISSLFEAFLRSK